MGGDWAARWLALVGWIGGGGETNVGSSLRPRDRF